MSAWVRGSFDMSLSDSCIVSGRIDTCLSIRHIGSDFFGLDRDFGLWVGFFRVELG